jgi:hypothetical protein
MEFVTDLKFMDFKASNGWLESWRSRFSIGFFKVYLNTKSFNSPYLLPLLCCFRWDVVFSSNSCVYSLFLLESWRSRFSIGFFKVCGESADVDDNVVDDFRSKIGKIVEGYKAEDIFVALSRNSKTFHKFIYFCNPFSENVRGHQCFFFYCKIQGDCQCFCF